MTGYSGDRAISGKAELAGRSCIGRTLVAVSMQGNIQDVAGCRVARLMVSMRVPERGLPGKNSERFRVSM